MQHHPEKPDTTIAFRLPADQIAFLREQAEANERTVSGEIRRLIRRSMDEEKEAA